MLVIISVGRFEIYLVKIEGFTSCYLKCRCNLNCVLWKSDMGRKIEISRVELLRGKEETISFGSHGTGPGTC